jgi:GT2 family glycosyltransferase
LDPARASNLGAGLAAGGAVLFMSAGVLPKRVRWLSQLLRQYRALERSGVLGCRLLYEDGSIAHAGLGFRRAAEFPEWWTLDRWAKGLPVGFDRHTGAAPVPAVDGAALMVDRALFGELGGLSEDYMFGGFAAADLCLAAQRQGSRTYYTPEIELYSVTEDAAWPAASVVDLAREAHDMWRFNKKWAEVLGRMADENSVAI